MKKRVLILLFAILLCIGLVIGPFSMSHAVGVPPVRPPASLPTIQSQGIAIDGNGTIIVSGNVSLSGDQTMSTYDGHGAIFVSGNFIIKSSADLH
ncbi:MAG: hypothetical protein ACP5MU_06850, partial [Thermoplasmata archaeon]